MKSTTRFSRNKRGIICLNCEQPISDNDNFCSNCGQVNDELPLSIKQFISEFFAGFFSFDSRFFKTFFPLLFKPGRVSIDYVKGKRRRYVNPFQLYLHVTIIFFLLQGLFSALDEYKLTGSFSKNNTSIVMDSVSKVTDSILKETDIILNEVQEDLKSKGIAIAIDSLSKIGTTNTIADSTLKKLPYPYTNKKSDINALKQNIKVHIDSVFENSPILKQLKNKLLTTKQKDSIFEEFYNQNMQFIAKTINNDSIDWKVIKHISALEDYSTNYIEEILEAKNIDYALPEKTKISIDDKFIKDILGQSLFKKVSNFMTYDKEHKEVSVGKALNDLGYKKTRWNIFYYKKAQDFNKFKNNSDFRNSYVDTVISKISIALFFMLPVFTLFLSLLYMRGKKNYTEHLVFVFNVQTAFFIFLIFFTIFNRILKTDIGIGLFFLVFLFYLYKSLRNFYKQNRLKTSIKYFMLNTIYVFLASIGFLIISFLSFIL